ncbi:MAG: sodium ion-translocating decarboxylase subunit beta [Bacilli bacterium]|nr:sodium ion-translocating decarboxylase subunit beta [Bacilli bacterium]
MSFEQLGEFFKGLWESTGIAGFFADGGWKNLIMIVVACVLLFLAIKKKFEPYLLLPIAFGMLLVNLPFAGKELFIETVEHVEGGKDITHYSGLLGYLYYGVKLGIYPCLIFLCIGATTDFGPLIANKKLMLLGAAAQIGIFLTFIIAISIGKIPGISDFLSAAGSPVTIIDGKVAASIGIIGGADGPTAILVTSKLKEELLPSISIAAYSYMALVPVIFPPIIKLLTTKKERSIKMEVTREVSKREKILFPIVVTAVVILLVPSAAPLIGCLMLGNLIKESGVVPKITETLANSLMYIVTILLGTCVGATATAEKFLNPLTLIIFALGIFAFSLSAASGVLAGKLMCKITKGKVNPMIGAAGVSAVPMAARVVHKMGQEENSDNYLLMHAMGPNVAGVIGSAVAAGLLLLIFA